MKLFFKSKNLQIVKYRDSKRYLVESFEFITPISESSHGIDVEGVFSLADGGDALLQLGDMDFLICLLTVI